jgi:outer membrane lipoprotein-sorting protein
MSRRVARWAVPAGVVAVLAGGLVLVPVVAGADPSLPERSAAELLGEVGEAQAQPFSGTVVESADLGFPALPSSGDSPSLSDLVTGSNTARIWYASPDKARVALLGTLAETDVIRNGSDVWIWTSDENTAQHFVLPEDSGESDDPVDTPAPSVVTPSEAAEQALEAVDPTTRVTVDGTAEVAGRPVYELVLAPKDERSLIGQVRLAVDSETSMPLRVQVYAAGATEPAFETGFTSVSFSTPDDSVFAFSPPPGAEVEESELPTEPRPRRDIVPDDRDEGQPTIIGEGWTSVAVLRGVDVAGLTGGSDRRSGAAQTLLQALTPVSGAYGSGRLLTTDLASALLLDDGRLLVGAVPPSVLEEVAVDPRAGE